jgi:hypothetical protein
MWIQSVSQSLDLGSSRGGQLAGSSTHVIVGAAGGDHQFVGLHRCDRRGWWPRCSRRRRGCGVVVPREGVSVRFVRCVSFADSPPPPQLFGLRAPSNQPQAGRHQSGNARTCRVPPWLHRDECGGLPRQDAQHERGQRHCCGAGRRVPLQHHSSASFPAR